MKRNHETPDEVRHWLFQEIERLWPVALGSVSLRKNPCIREHCEACETGEGHPAYALSFRKEGRQSSIYIPDDLSEEMETAVANGRRWKELIAEAGRRYLKARKATRPGR